MIRLPMGLLPLSEETGEHYDNANHTAPSTST